MPRTSVDPVASLDDMRGRGWEPSKQADIYEDLPPNRDASASEIMRLLQEVNRANPIALNVLLDSAVDRMSRKDIAKHLRKTVRTVQGARRWIARHRKDLAVCLNNPS